MTQAASSNFPWALPGPPAPREEETTTLSATLIPLTAVDCGLNLGLACKELKAQTPETSVAPLCVRPPAEGEPRSPRCPSQEPP